MDRKWMVLFVFVLSFGIFAILNVYPATMTEYSNKVILDSDIVEFAYVSLNRTIDNVTVSWLFHNIAGRMLNLSITAEFYDKKGDILFSKTNELLKFPVNYTEYLLLPANRIIYDGPYVSEVDHVVLHVVEG